MTATLKININQLNEEFMQRLKEQYEDAILEISIAPSENVAPMSEMQFWQIIDLLNWEAENNDDILRPALNQLSDLSIGAIYQFQNILCEKLYQLDQEKLAKQLGYGSEQYFSVDIFLYARACVVANGKDTFTAVLSGEMEMPEDLTFEPILSLASRAYEQKTGKQFIPVPSCNYETFSNKEGWSETSK